jgi:hypothetical protein
MLRGSNPPCAVRIEKVGSLPRDDCDVTIFQIVEHVGKRREGNRVGPAVTVDSGALPKKSSSVRSSERRAFENQQIPYRESELSRNFRLLIVTLE